MRDRLRDAAAAAGWAALLLICAVVLLSAVLSPATNWTVRAALAGFCIVAIARPDAALLVTIALLGFGIILSHLAGVPSLRVTEVLIVASLAGCCARALPRGAPFRPSVAGTVTAPVVLFAMAAVASTIVWMRVYQFEAGPASAYLRAFRQFATRDYFVQPDAFLLVVSTAVILEGLALYVAVATLCRIDTTFFERALRMLAVGGAGLAVMSVVRLAEILLRSPDAIATLRASPSGLRISPQIPDYIAAGSYFSLCWLAAVGLAIASPGRRLMWLATSVPLLAALFLTGSRSVIAAALVGLIVLALVVVRRRAVAARGVLVLAAAAVVVMVGSYSWMTGRDVAGDTAQLSMSIRVELLRTGLRVIETRPLFGVGIDRFYLLAAGLASPFLRAQWPARMNPHNDFLRFGAELGLIGLGLFLWILAAAGMRIWRALRVTRDPRLAGVVAGLLAFLVTSMVSNPLMVREVSYVFWIALGLAVGHSAGPLRSRDGSGGSASEVVPTWRRHLPRMRTAAALLAGGLLLFSIPIRARQEIAGVDLGRVAYGLSDWRSDDGMKWRWSGPKATVFVDGRARLVEIPVRGTLPSGAPQQVEVLVDGQLANRFAVGREWQRLRTLVPESSSNSPRRIDLLISPTWVPAEVLPRNTDRRVLGVRVGELKVVLAPDQ